MAGPARQRCTMYAEVVVHPCVYDPYKINGIGCCGLFSPAVRFAHATIEVCLCLAGPGCPVHRYTDEQKPFRFCIHPSGSLLYCRRKSFLNSY
ncbi:hypothetical protein ACQJBY_016436 [Aegilops geniculata]